MTGSLSASYMYPDRGSVQQRFHFLPVGQNESLVISGSFSVASTFLLSKCKLPVNSFQMVLNNIFYKTTDKVLLTIMNITLSGIEKGKWRYLTPVEISEINKMVANSVKTAPPEFYPKNKI